MAEVFGTAGEAVQVAGDYGCTLCGHRRTLGTNEQFPADHHEGHPWTLMVSDSLPDARTEGTS
jgi:hypothetical protein